MNKKPRKCRSCGQPVTPKGGVFSAQADVTVEPRPPRGTPIHNWRDLITDESLKELITAKN